MKRLILIMLLFILFMIPQSLGFAAQYPDPNRQTIWNTFTDTWHTMGQSPRQAALTKMRLHNARTIARIGSINRAKRQAWMQGSN